MNIIIDACSIINLFNSDSILVSSGLRRCRIWLTPFVVGECDLGNAADLMEAEEGCYFRLNDGDIPVDRFLELISEHGLGAGETECIAAAEALGYSVCSDDRQARALARQVLGEDRVLGSARLLKWCVEEELVQCVDAAGRFTGMKAAGGFLPPLANDFFCVGDC